MSFWETLIKIVQTILIMSVTGSVIALLLFVLKPIIKNRFPKSVQYYLWCLALVSFFVPFSVIVSLPFATPMTPIQNIIETDVKPNAEWQNQIAMELYDVPYTQLHDPEQVNVSHSEFKARNIGNYNFFLPYILIVGIIYLLKELVQYNIYLLKLKRKRLTAQINELNLLPENCPRLFYNPLAATPMLVGLFRPVIYLPDREYSEQQLQNILLHELTHWRRHDVAIKWIATITVCMHWFNPFAYLVRREIDRACELACDEAVISGLDNDGKQSYGDTLIEMASDIKKSRAVVSTTMYEEKKTLKERLSSIMHSKKQTTAILLLSIVLICVIFVTTVFVGASSSVVEQHTSPNGKITTTIYNQDVSGFFPKDTGFTIKDTGDLIDTRVYSDGSTFENLYWSPCSRYMIISTLREGERLLELKRYEKSSVTNLNLYINMSMSSYEEFTRIMSENSWDTLKFNFIEWIDEDANVKVNFAFKDFQDKAQIGTLIYNCESGVIYEIEFENK